MTDNEIIKALEGMIQFANTVDRSVLDMVDVKTLKNILDLINRLQAENKKWQGGYMTQKQEIANLEIELKAMRGAANSYKAKNERLKAKVNHYNYCYENFVNTPISRIKSEAYKEFAEELKKRSIGIRSNFDFKTDIDNLLKEMVGEDNGN